MLAKGNAPNDMLMAGILAAVDRERYRSAARPPWVGAKLLWLVPRLLWGFRGLLWNQMKAVAAPELAYRAYRQTVEDLEVAVRDAGDENLPLDELQRRGETHFVEAFDPLMGAVVVG